MEDLTLWHAFQKEADSSRQLLAVEWAEEVLRQAKRGIVAALQLSELENEHLAGIHAPISIAKILLETLSQEALWSHPGYYIIRGLIARLARKFLMKHFFMDGTVFVKSSSTEMKRLLETATARANQADRIWPESGSLSQLSILSRLVACSKSIAQNIQTMHNAENTIFDLYTKASLTVLPLAGHCYSQVNSLVGRNHLVESTLLLDIVYVALWEKHEGAAEALADLLACATGWKCTYNILECVEWAFHRDLLRDTHITAIRPHIAALTTLFASQRSTNGWRVCEKLATLFILMSTRGDQFAQQMLSELKRENRNPIVEKVLTYFASMKIPMKPEMPAISNLITHEHFKGRDMELAEASRVLTEQRIVTLVGPAGIGKSYMACALASRLDSFRIVWICNAETPAEFLASLKSLSRELGLKSFQMDQLLHVFSFQKTLLIVDNLRNYLPHMEALRHKAFLVITSRNSLLPGSIFLHGLELPAAVDLVAEISGRLSEEENLQCLCEALSCIPAPLVNICGPLSDTSNSIQTVLDCIHSYPENFDNIYSGFFQAVKSQLKDMQQAKTLGVKTLLLTAALLSSKGIPKALYTAIFEGVERKVPINPALATLQSVSFVYVDSEERLYMSELYQRLVLRCIPKFTDVLKESTKQLLAQFSISDPVNSELYSSAEILALKTSAKPTSNQVKLCLRVAAYQLKVLRERQATETLVSKCLLWAETYKFDVEICEELAKCLAGLGQYQLADQWCSRAVQLPCTNRLDKVASYNSIFAIYRAMGNNETALECQLKSILIIEEELGPHHIDLAVSFNRVSEVYRDMGNLEEAVQYQLKSIGIKEAVLRPQHRDMAASYSTLSELYRIAGRQQEAEEYHNKALRIQ